MRSILFISSTSLGTNPRMVKEIDLAQRYFKCTVLSFRLGNWSDKLDLDISRRYPNIKFIFIDAGRQNLWQWVSSTIIEKLVKLFYPFFKSNLLVNAFGHSKRSFLLLKRLRQIENHNLIIAHNLAALYPAFVFSKKHSTRFAFDIEDYHPGELIHKSLEDEHDRRVFLLSRILPYSIYLSAASEFIGNYTIQNTGLKNTELVYNLIPNCFSETEFSTPLISETHSKIKIVWFSQYITSGRGLEELLEAIVPLQNKIELHLIGSLKSHFEPILKKTGLEIQVHSPMPQQKLHAFLSKFDVGLALEMSAVDINKDIAVSNKIYTYAQAANFILATDTLGHTWFIRKYPWSGILVSQNVESIRQALIHLISNKNVIREQAKFRFEKAKELSWEKENTKLIELWS